MLAEGSAMRIEAGRARSSSPPTGSLAWSLDRRRLDATVLQAASFEMLGSGCGCCPSR